MKKGDISNILRKLRLLYFTDLIRFYYERFKNRKINNKFKKENPEVVLPPDYLIYESFQINYKKYFSDSIESAKWLVGHFEKHIDLKDKKILDWGCGPGRIIRHLPSIIGSRCEFFGTDYNKETIQWCKENLKNISFNLNSLDAKLPYENNFADVIYGISIFTHLSENQHYKWYNELYRVLNHGGIMFLTTQGDNFKVKLTNEELKQYNNNELIVRGNVKEGHRTFSAFHPEGFMKKLFSNVQILEHVKVKSDNSNPQQDIWIIKKL